MLGCGGEIAIPKQVGRTPEREHSRRDSSSDIAVLVVDDDQELSNALVHLMRRVGLNVQAAADGRTALTALDAQTFDVVLLDLRMANVDGFGVLEALRSRPDAPEVILHSGYLDVQTTVQAMRAGAAEVLEKPVDFKVLLDRVKHCASQASEKRQRGSFTSEVAAAPPEGPLASLLGESQLMADLRYRVQCVAAFRDMAVLIEGATGTGKELVARAIHDSAAPMEPFVTLNCAAVPDHLFESELFGHEAGAFTSARGTRIGLLEEAGGGTLFLDEIGEMPSTLQPKLLRVLETREFRRVGSNKTRRFRARVVSATNRTLSSSDATFRSDLYYRLAGYAIRTAPLVERLGDLPKLSAHFLNEFCKRYGANVKTLSPDAIPHLESYSWPGNIRELRRVIENAAMLSPSDVVEAGTVRAVLLSRESDGPMSSSGVSVANHASLAHIAERHAAGGHTSLPELEKELIVQTFRESGENLSRAARQLGIPRSTLRDRLKKYGVR